MAASAAATGQNAFFGQYPGLFDPSRTSHLADWHLHSASFHNAQGKLLLFFGFYFQNCVLIYELWGEDPMIWEKMSYINGRMVILKLIISLKMASQKTIPSFYECLPLLGVFCVQKTTIPRRDYFSKGPFKYYIIMFLTFLGPPTTSLMIYSKSSRIAIVWPTHTPLMT